jgi:hypothetical protein
MIVDYIGKFRRVDEMCVETTQTLGTALKVKEILRDLNETICIMKPSKIPDSIETRQCRFLPKINIVETALPCPTRHTDATGIDK